MHHLRLSHLAYTSLIVILACGDDDSGRDVSIEEVVESARGAVQNATRFARQERETLERRIEERLDEIAREVARLESERERAGQDARREINRDLDYLRSQQRAMQGRLVRLREAGDEALKDLRDDITRGFKELEDFWTRRGR